MAVLRQRNFDLQKYFRTKKVQNNIFHNVKPVSQFLPVYPAGHVHVYPPLLSFEHEAPFLHWPGLSSHGKTTNSIKFENQFFLVLFF